MNTLPKLSYDECLAAMDIKKGHLKDLPQIVKEVIQERNSMVQEGFSKLLRYVIEQSSDKLISSEDLYLLWLFFSIGVYTNSAGELSDLGNFSPLTIKQLVRLGPVTTRKLLYDRCYKLLTENPNRYMFEGTDPTKWYENMLINTGDLQTFIKTQEQDETIPILQEICNILSDSNCDPVKQQ
jgi:hypothetical protein